MQLNTNFISLPKKIVLETYEKPSEGQFFHKCTFHIPTDIPAGRGGTYQVVINEALFRNTHPILEYGDYFKVSFPENPEITDINIEVDKNYYFNNSVDFVAVMNQLLATSAIQFKVLGSNETPTGNGVMISSANPFELEYSVNFGYIFNNINKIIPSVNKNAVANYAPEQIESVEQSTDSNVVVFPFLSFKGPFNYYIKTNLIPQVPTYNEIGQTFNMNLATYNTTYGLGEFVQMGSTMINITKNITCITFELLNDMLEPVRIKSPIHFQLTITPYLDSSNNMTYYK